MPGVSLRGKVYRVWWHDESGKVRWRNAFPDRKKSLDLAWELERAARMVRDGLVERGSRERQAAAAVGLDVHIDLWRQHMLDQDSGPKHARHQAGAARKLLEAAGVKSIADFSADAVTAALGRMKASGKSPRTCNHALGAVKAFYHWLEDTRRIKEQPAGIRKGLRPYSQETDRRRVRRALTPAELARLVALTSVRGPDHYIYGPTKSKLQRIPVTGPERGLLYLIAAGTGFRANEIRSLTPESFDLTDPERASVTVAAGYSKRRREDRQPISPALAAEVSSWLAYGRPLPRVPDRTSAMLAKDLELAGIERTVGGKVVDFHSLRATYITHIVKRGTDPATAQRLARHSDVRLTLSTYTDTSEDEMRKAIGGKDA